MDEVSSINIDDVQTSVEDLSIPFKLQAMPKTDIYATPLSPIRHAFSAPIICRRMPKKAFQSAKATVRSRWSLQFDQGGLLFVMPASTNPNPDSGNAQVHETHPEWIKAGIEVNDGRPYASVVAKCRDNWCDWSLVPLPHDPKLGAESGVALEFTRSSNALMVWMVQEYAKILIRKVPWVFLETGNEEVLVGVYCARPDPDDQASVQQNKLTVSFSGVHFG